MLGLQQRMWLSAQGLLARPSVHPSRATVPVRDRRFREAEGEDRLCRKLQEGGFRGFALECVVFSSDIPIDLGNCRGFSVSVPQKDAPRIDHDPGAILSAPEDAASPLALPNDFINDLSSRAIERAVQHLVDIFS